MKRKYENPCGLIFFDHGDGRLDVCQDLLSSKTFEEIFGPEPDVKEGESLESYLSHIPNDTASAIRSVMKLQKSAPAIVLNSGGVSTNHDIEGCQKGCQNEKSA